LSYPPIQSLSVSLWFSARIRQELTNYLPLSVGNATAPGVVCSFYRRRDNKRFLRMRGGMHGGARR